LWPELHDLSLLVLVSRREHQLQVLFEISLLSYALSCVENHLSPQLSTLMIELNSRFLVKE
jgi:hypothetical protein